jgi:atypical dual specificity phosphatase
VTPSSVLTLDGFGVAFGERVVLAALWLTFPTCGATVLLGPAGSGKSTLLRTLAGLNDAQPSLRTWGHATYYGRGPNDVRPAFMMQHARLLTATVRENLVSGLPERSLLARREQDEAIRSLLRASQLEELEGWLDRDAVSLPSGLQRRLCIARVLAARPAMLMVDEPTAGLSDSEASAVIDLLRSESRERSVVVVTHQQEHARALGGMTALLAGGRVLEHARTEVFFHAPQTAHAAAFVLHGGCKVASPMAKPEELADDVAKPPSLPPAAREMSRHAGPRGFRWLKPNQLGGTPRPGIVGDLRDDLHGLRQLGVRVLISLEETQTIDFELLRASGFLPHHVATADMGVPSLGETFGLCCRVAAWNQAGDVVAIHCKAGLGRTGTMLACQLIFEGESPLRALERVRQINPSWIQSERQVSFLTEFFRSLPKHQTDRAEVRGT